MSTRITSRAFEIIAFSWLFFSHCFLWFIGLGLVIGLLLLPYRDEGPLIPSLAMLPAFCLAFGWCIYRIRNRTIPKNGVYFFFVFLRLWLIWLIFFVAVFFWVVDTFEFMRPSRAGLVGPVVCNLAALFVSIGLTCYNVKKDYLANSEYPPKKFEFPETMFESLGFNFSTKRS